MLRFAVAAVNVDNIRHDLKRIKRNSDWERQRLIFDTQRKKRIEVFNNKARILEKSEHKQIENDGADKDAPSCFRLAFMAFKVNSGVIVIKDAQKHQHYIDRLAPCIEHKT